jgi:outer membrane protein assembly factor BamB
LIKMRDLTRLNALSCLSAAGMILAAASPCWSAEAWQRFRGPGGSGIAVDGDCPIHFGPDSNVVWKTDVPPGSSSPCIWESNLFLTAFNEGRLETICFERSEGTVRWRRLVEPGKIERGARLGTPCDSTPCTDGRRLYVYFAPFGLVCYDFAGEEQWRHPLPTPVTQHGAATSPVMFDDRVLLACDQDVGSFLLAVSATNGEPLWQTGRPGYRRGFSTPLLWPPEKPEIAVLPGTLRLTAYALSDGAEQWVVAGLPNEMVSSPTSGEGLIFVAGWTHGAGASRLPKYDELLEKGDRDGDGRLTRQEAPEGPARNHFQYIDADKDGSINRDEWDSLAKIFEQSKNAVLAVRPGGRGNVTATHVAWEHTRGLPYVPSPLCYEGRVYLVKNGGMLSCFEARTGKVLFQEERLGALGDYYASPVAAGGKVCVISQPGVAVVLRAGDTLDVLARNRLGEPVMATPAIVGNTLYVRTQQQLFAFRSRDG